MQLRCTFCQTMFAISRDEMLAALERLDEEKLKYYDAHCPKCRRANRVERFKLELAYPAWKADLRALVKQAAETQAQTEQAAAPQAAPAKAAPAEKSAPKAAPVKAKEATKPASAKGKTAPKTTPAKAKAPAKPAPAKTKTAPKTTPTAPKVKQPAAAGTKKK